MTEKNVPASEGVLDLSEQERVRREKPDLVDEIMDAYDRALFEAKRKAK